MARLTPEVLSARIKTARDEIALNRQLYEDADEYTNPFKNGFKDKNGTHNTNTKSYDSTAMIAANNFVNTMVSKFTPPFMRWAELLSGPAIKEEDRARLNKDLEKVSNITFSNINASNFATASPEMYWELGKGTGVLIVLEGDEFQPFNFIAPPLSQMGFLEGKRGTVDFITRTWKIKPGLIKHTWHKALIPDSLQDLIKDDKQKAEDVEIVECFYYDYEELVWHYDVFYEKEKHILYRSDSVTCPVIVVRWLKIPGFVTGIGPVVLALSDIKTLNKMKELMLKLAALNVFGVYTVTNDGVFNPSTIKMKPGAFIPVQRNGGPEGKTIEPLPTAGNFQLQEYMINDLKDQIRQIMLDNRLPPENGPVRSVFELSQRIKELSTDIGASFGRLMYEYIIPLFRRCLEIEKNKGLISLPEGIDIDNFFVQIRIVSPIAQQQSVEDLQRFTQAYQICQSIDPQIAELAFSLEKIPDFICEKLGSPASLLRDEEKRQEIKEMVIQRATQIVAQMMTAENNGDKNGK